MNLSQPLLVFALISCLNAVSAQNPQPFGRQDVDVAPSFPGGSLAWGDFASKTLVYPPDALDAEASGKVYVAFTVQADGSVTNVYYPMKTLRDIRLIAEAIRVVRLSPKWIPAEKAGQKVPCKMILNFPFRIGC